MIVRGFGAALHRDSLNRAVSRGARMQLARRRLHTSAGERTRNSYLWTSLLVAASATAYATTCQAEAPREPLHIVERNPFVKAGVAVLKAKEPELPYATCTEFYTANNPREDRSCAQIALLNGETVYVVGMLDGHGGHQCAEYARTRLGDFVIEYLQQCRAVDDENKENGATLSKFTGPEIERALVNAFERTDRSFLAAISSAFHAGFTRLSRVGACSLFCVFYGDKLYTANAGDCQAVMARAGRTDLEAVVLNNEHNARVAVEAERLGREHPGEDNVVKCKPDNENACYVKGRLQPTRSLGDAELKYQEFNATPIKAPYTPPYITATPEVIFTKITSKDKFVVIATDGLWDHLSPAEAVKIAEEVLYCPDSQGQDQDTVIRRACRTLIDHALHKAAEHAGMDVSELKALPLGRERRKKHDDITVTIVKLR